MEYTNGILHIHSLSLIFTATLIFMGFITAFIAGAGSAYKHISEKEETREILQKKATVLQARLRELRSFPGTHAYEYPKLKAHLEEVNNQLNALAG